MTNNIFDFSDHKQDLVAILKENVHILDDTYLAGFANPKFRAKDTGISRGDLSKWKDKGLLPGNYRDDKWTNYCLIECIWLKVISKLKMFGFENLAILEIKEALFNQSAEGIKNLYQQMLAQEGTPENFQTLGNLALKDLELVSDSELEETLVKSKYSLFGMLVMWSYLLKLEFAFLINEKRDVCILNLGKPVFELQEQIVSQTIRSFANQSFLLINLKSICNDFFDNEHILPDTNYYFGLMNPGERKVITDIRSGLYKEVCVKVKNGSITHIKTSHNNNEDAIKKLSRLFKKGQYVTVQLIAKDGEIVSYQEDEITKLK